MTHKIGIVVILIVTIGLFYSLLSQIYNSLQAGHRLDQAVTELADLQRKNTQLQNRLIETDSLRFIEQQARDNLNMARPEDTVVIISQKQIDNMLKIEEIVESPKLPHWQGWLQLFIH